MPLNVVNVSSFYLQKPVPLLLSHKLELLFFSPKYGIISFQQTASLMNLIIIIIF